MNKLELIQALKDATDLSKSEAAVVVDIFFNEMAKELAKGGRVKIKPKKLPFFKPGKELKDRVDS